MLALSIRQPWAELIMRGEKAVEYRSQLTRKRGRIYIYASLGRLPRGEEAEIAAELGIDVAALPRGVVIGTVELCDCTAEPGGGWAWHLTRPERWRQPRPPDRHPMPVWFTPW